MICCLHYFDGVKDFIRDRLFDVRCVFFETSDRFSQYVENIKQNFSQDTGNKLFELQCENVKLRQKADELKEVMAENNALKVLLKIKETSERPIIFAKVIDVFNTDFTKAVLIDAGSNQNVKPDSFAYNENGLIGRIIEVHENWSEVLLITDDNSNIPAKIDETNVMLCGNNSNLLRVDLLNKEISEGMIATTSSYGKVFREGIAIGKVVQKSGRWFVQPFVNFDNLKYVCIGSCEN